MLGRDVPWLVYLIYEHFSVRRERVCHGNLLKNILVGTRGVNRLLYRIARYTGIRFTNNCKDFSARWKSMAANIVTITVKCSNGIRRGKLSTVAPWTSSCAHTTSESRIEQNDFCDTWGYNFISTNKKVSEWEYLFCIATMITNRYTEAVLDMRVD